MDRLKQFKTLVVEDIEEEGCMHPGHRHNFFEIIYVYKGCGTHYLNEHPTPYQTGDLFLIAPEDRHHFRKKNKNRLIFIQFTDHYFLNKRHLSPDEFLMSDPATLMRHKMLREMRLVLDEPCKTILKNIIENILAYNHRKDVATSPIIFYHILSILGLVKEAMAKHNIHLSGAPRNKELLVTYIHEHIYEPSEIQIKRIAAEFNIAPGYFSAYFKRDFGIPYRDYINNLRTTLIGKRILQGRMSLKEIAVEFGFSDQSHLSHFIRKKLKASPGDYRQQRLHTETA
jgi:AraC-like DNA-binding protein